ALGWTRPAWAPQCFSCNTTSLLLPLLGEIFYPPSPIVPAGENVTLVGDVHVVTLVGPNFLSDLYMNMAGVQGTGQTSGSLYIGTGSQKVLRIQWPPVPVTPQPITGFFTLETTNGAASIPFAVIFAPVFASDGTLLPASTVTAAGT